MGRIHPEGKKSEKDVKNVTDDITQEHLNNMKLEGIALTAGHPPNGESITKHPNLVRGFIRKTIITKNGELWGIGFVDHNTLQGCLILSDIKGRAKEGLSLGHRFEEVRNSKTGKLVSRRYIPDHVAIVETPRRDGCYIYQPNSNSTKLTRTEHTSQTLPDINTTCNIQVNASIETPPPVFSNCSSSQFISNPSPNYFTLQKSTMASEAAPPPAAAYGGQAPPENGGNPPGGFEQASTPMDTSPDMPERERAIRSKLGVDLSSMSQEELARHLIDTIVQVDAKEAALKEHQAKLEEYKRKEAEMTAKKAEEIENRSKRAFAGLAQYLRQLNKAAADKRKAEGKEGEHKGEVNVEDPEEMWKIVYPNGIKTPQDMEREAGLNKIFSEISVAAASGVRQLEENEKKYAAFRSMYPDMNRPNVQTYLSSIGSAGSAPKRKRMSEDYQSTPASYSNSSTSNGEQSQKSASFYESLLEKISNQKPENGRMLLGSMHEAYGSIPATGQSRSMYPAGYKPLMRTRQDM